MSLNKSIPENCAPKDSSKFCCKSSKGKSLYHTLVTYKFEDVYVLVKCISEAVSLLHLLLALVPEVCRGTRLTRQNPVSIEIAVNAASTGPCKYS